MFDLNKTDTGQECGAMEQSRGVNEYIYFCVYTNWVKCKRKTNDININSYVYVNIHCTILFRRWFHFGKRDRAKKKKIKWQECKRMSELYIYLQFTFDMTWKHELISLKHVHIFRKYKSHHRFSLDHEICRCRPPFFALIQWFTVLLFISKSFVRFGTGNVYDLKTTIHDNRHMHKYSKDPYGKRISISATAIALMNGSKFSVFRKAFANLSIITPNTEHDNTPDSIVMKWIQ